MPAPILYCGDTSLATAASYLAGLLTAADEEFDYCPSDRPLSEAELHAARKLIILSDYPSARLSSTAHAALAEQVRSGAGLLMIGGWESFHGLGGDWDRSPLAALLPVETASEDDRINCDQPAFVRRLQEHSITQGLPWDERPPVIGGFNRFTARADAQTLLAVDRCRARRDGDGWSVAVEATHPLLVVRDSGSGRVAALATDVAPHWVGGLVDWGEGRVTAQASGAEAIEVGDLYAKFFQQLISWTKGDGR